MIIHELANDPIIRERVSIVARAQMKRRGEDYQALAIFDREDLSQTVWLELCEMHKAGFKFGPFVSTPSDFSDLCIAICEKMARTGSRKRAGYSVIRFSELDKADKVRLGLAQVRRRKRKRH